MAKRSIDGVDVVLATEAQLASFPKAEEAVRAFDVPRMYDSGDPKARVFFALFDGTGNDMVKHPERLSNIGLLTNQVDALSRKNDHIGFFYKEGPGTQDGLRGIYDGATGGTYLERVEAMYEQCSDRATDWVEEDPDVTITVIAVGFSRGAEQAAGFARMLHERGLRNTQGSDAPPLRAPGTTPQALALFDPVATIEPANHDRRPPPSVVSGFQIVAADERRTAFPSTSIMPQGKSEDGRFLALTTAGAHCDNGGSYALNGLSERNFNVMRIYLNNALGEEAIDKRAVPEAPEMNVIHDSVQHKMIYFRAAERGIVTKLEPTGKLPMEPMDPAVRARLAPKPVQDRTAHEAPRHDLNRNQAATALAASGQHDANIRQLQKNPAFERHSMEDLSKIAFYRSLIIAREKDAPQDLRDATVAHFDKTMQDPAAVRRLPEPAAMAGQLQAAPVGGPSRQRDSTEMSL